MTRELIALLDGREVGRVRRDRRGRLSFAYDDRWRAAPRAYPLSLSMPLAAAEHGHTVVESFLWGLLPDNPIVLERWAKRFQVSPRNAFALIANVGEDCAGAVQFVRPERLESLLAGKPGDIAWLDEKDIAARLRTLRADHAAWRSPGDTGQFSLAGAQPKTALLFEDGRWGVPSGRTPTTHILKPPTGEFDGHIENEHFCLSLARALGLPTAVSRVMRFEDEIAIVVERYDRVRTPAGLARVHQEDTCQALGLPPTKKYENEGGPGARDIAGLLRLHSRSRDEDVATFVDALAFNWLIAGTDAHAKNYSLLIGSAGGVRLAPLYDLASALPYGDLDPYRLTLAMKVGGTDRLRDIGARDWQRLARELRLDPDAVVSRIDGLASRLPDLAADTRREALDQGLAHPIVARLAEAAAARARECRAVLHMGGGPVDAP
ncbi:MAG TPA: type II toxin-antitoxin system HipA family toxin [Thermodesulfobacteriota bacterium]